MRISIGSKNLLKFNCVRTEFEQYPLFRDASYSHCKAHAGVPNPPLTLADTVLGGVNKAKNSFVDCDLSVGLEDGLIEVPFTETGLMNTCCCVIYNGRHFFPGLSPLFEIPPSVAVTVKDFRMPVNKALYETGLTSTPDLPVAKSVVDILSGGQITRMDYTKSAIRMALISLKNSGIYPI